MQIIPGVGLGSIKFGFTEEGIINEIGKPDRIEDQQYIEGSEEWNRDLWYFQRNLTFTLDSEDDFRLGIISITGSGYPLFGKELFGSPLRLIKSTLTKHTNEIPKYENFTHAESELHECLAHEGTGLRFWFESGLLSEIQCGYLFEEDNETVIWPKKS